MNNPLTIGKVARRAGVGVETVRFYERQGLPQEPDLRASGYRQYDEAVVARLRFIRRAKELGFTLKEIAELLELRHDPAATRSDVREKVRGKVEAIEARIRDLLRIKDVLLALERSCLGHAPPRTARSWRRSTDVRKRCRRRRRPTILRGRRAASG